jgi:hypothetical protein
MTSNDSANTAAKKGRRLITYAVEIGKWVLVIWLIWPIHKAVTNKVDIPRLLLGMLLFIIFAGKLFYDTVLQGQLKFREGSGRRGILEILGIAIGLAFLVGTMILFIGLLTFFIVQNSMHAEVE